MSADRKTTEFKVTIRHSIMVTYYVNATDYEHAEGQALNDYARYRKGEKIPDMQVDEDIVIDDVDTDSDDRLYVEEDSNEES